MLIQRDIHRIWNHTLQKAGIKAIALAFVDIAVQHEINIRACLHYLGRACLSLFCAPARRKARDVVRLHEQLTRPSFPTRLYRLHPCRRTQPGRKTARPCGFGLNSVNRPWTRVNLPVALEPNSPTRSMAAQLFFNISLMARRYFGFMPCFIPPHP